jgi:hypothetical protein
MAISITKATVGGNENSWGSLTNTALDTIVDAVNGTTGTVEPNLSALKINGTAVTSTAAELNILDGVTSTAAELNILDGVTSTAAELNILDGVTSTAAELNILDGVTATTAELNYVGGVTSNVQTQIDSKVSGSNAAATITTLTSTTVNATTVDLGDWTITQSGSDLKFAYQGTDRLKLTSAGALTVEGDVTASGDA